MSKKLVHKADNATKLVLKADNATKLIHTADNATKLVQLVHKAINATMQRNSIVKLIFTQNLVLARRTQHFTNVSLALLHIRQRL